MTPLATSVQTLRSDLVAAASRRDAAAMARLARRVPAPIVDVAISSPFRRVVVGEIFRRMPYELKPGGAVDAVVRFDVGEEGVPTESWLVEIAGGRCRTSRAGRNAGGAASGPRPRTTIELSPRNLVRVATGESRPMEMFQRGEIKISGDLFFAATFSGMFRIPSA